ncbi:hypothetical protein EJ08DRAFT_600641 [Tothia fuscella]|uniref:Oxo-4-hydroxy-4-carboxy-5-ureidoimidazoline decarboxylase domain-containing protein n=1 Tax=Tothia fuscella TaxID=1048955 RepID=A0A9P4TS95_9PEZI|nr:hypothetical protein EJ08DRAFT_600641 [Tothia fuscella]
MPSLPEIPNLPSLSTQERASILDLLFEPSTSLHTLSLPVTIEKYSTYDDLIIAIGMQLSALAESTSTSDKTWLESILSAHPRLGEKTVDSELSRIEQKAMDTASGGNDAGKEEEAKTLQALNEQYEKAFPGLRYVVFVNGRPRPVIFEDMQKRITRGDIAAERTEAIKAMCEIASDRARRLQ